MIEANLNDDDYDELEELINEQSDSEIDNIADKTEIGERRSPTTAAAAAVHQTSKNRKEWIKTDEEKRLENLVFGNKDALIENLRKQTADVSYNKNITADDNEENSTLSKAGKKRKPAWHDSDDEDTQVGEVLRETRFTGSLSHLNKEKTYKDYLTNKFQRIVAQPKWADLDREIEIDSDEEILQSVGNIVKSANELLPKTNIEFKRLKDLNRATYAEGSISSIQFHPTSTAALVTGNSGMASIYAIDGLKNDKLHNVYFKKFPIRCAKILPSGTEAFIGGSKNYYYTYDLMQAEESRVFLPKTITKMSKFEISPCGKYFAIVGRFGEIYLMDTNTKELLHTFKQEYQCTDLKFSNDSKKLITHSNESEICIIDLRKERIEHTLIDDGCIHGKCIDLSANNRMLAAGSNEGVCNIYNFDDIYKNSNPKPDKTVFNLTTSLSCVKFNHSSEILGISSELLPGAVKLVHLPSGTVFANFPGFQSNVGQVKTIEFSPQSGFMAFGNVHKEVPLFRLKHFKNY